MRHLALKLIQRHLQLSSVNVSRSNYCVLPLRIVLHGPVRQNFHTFGAILLSKESKKGEKALNEEEEEDEDEYYDDEDKEKRQKKRQEKLMSALTTNTYFDSQQKNKETFELMIEIYDKQNPTRRGVVEFIYAAMKHLEGYHVQYDLDIYKKLVKLMPEDKYVPENRWGLEFQLYPKQQDCIGRLLDFMEGKGLCADVQLLRMVRKRFGTYGAPTVKCLRQMYWSPRFRKANPWPIPFPPVMDPFLVAKLAIERICTADPQSTVDVWQSESVPDSLDHTYIVSGQSPTQKKLLEQLPRNETIYVEGPFLLWFGRARLNYFQLRADPKPLPEGEPEDPDDVSKLHNPFIFEKPSAVAHVPSVHELEEGIILAVCATGTSSRDSLLSWIRLLELNGNPALADIPVAFSLKAPRTDVTTQGGDGPISGDSTERVADI